MASCLRPLGAWLEYQAPVCGDRPGAPGAPSVPRPHRRLLPRGGKGSGRSPILPAEAGWHGEALGPNRPEKEAAAEFGAGVAVHEVYPSPVGGGVIEQGGETGGVRFAHDHLEAPADHIDHHIVLGVVGVRVARVPHQGHQPGAADGIPRIVN